MKYIRYHPVTPDRSIENLTDNKVYKVIEWDGGLFKILDDTGREAQYISVHLQFQELDEKDIVELILNKYK